MVAGPHRLLSVDPALHPCRRSPAVGDLSVIVFAALTAASNTASVKSSTSPPGWNPMSESHSRPTASAAERADRGLRTALPSAGGERRGCGRPHPEAAGIVWVSPSIESVWRAARVLAGPQSVGVRSGRGCADHLERLSTVAGGPFRRDSSTGDRGGGVDALVQYPRTTVP